MFKGHEPLIARPDPRRIDLRATLLDPYGGYRVKVHRQHDRTDLYVAADLSASMFYDSGRQKQQYLRDFLLSAAQSALADGDRIGFIGWGAAHDRPWLLPAVSTLQPVVDLLDRLATARPQQAPAQVVEIGMLPPRRALLFLVSDFHFPLSALDALLAPLTAHAVVPLVLWHDAEYTALPEWGLVRFQDAETGRSRVMLLRPRLKRDIVDRYTQRRQALRQAFRRHGMDALFAQPPFCPVLLSRYFHQRQL